MERKGERKNKISKKTKIIITIILAFLFLPYKIPAINAWITPALHLIIYIEKMVDQQQDKEIRNKCIEECKQNNNNNKETNSDRDMSCESQCTLIAKPVIYFYPPNKTEITVQLKYKGTLIANYPDYNQSLQGWKVTAYPDGRLINHDDNQEYSYLFWEGIPNKPPEYDLSKGFVIKGEDTKKFLQKILSSIGLTPKEYNEFIVYWYPRMKNNTYNLIYFAGEEYTATAPLTITPQPDSMLRVFMIFKPLKEKIDIIPQEIKSFERKGFTVVEWGGTEIQ